MKILFSIITAIICGYLAIITLDIEKAKKYKVFYSNDSEHYEKVTLKIKIIWLVAILVTGLSGLTSYMIFSELDDVLNICKMLVSLIVLSGSSCFDLREHRIPNIFPLILSVSGIVFLVIGILIRQEGALSYVVSSAFATFGCVISLMIASVLTNNGIGAGDVKLMGALAMIGGVYLVCGVLCISVFACALVGVILLILKKKTIKDGVPFGPFIFIGFVISIFTSIY